MSKSKKGLLHWFTKFEKTSTDKGMVGFLIKKKITKSKTSANFVLVCISGFFFAMSELIFVII